MCFHFGWPLARARRVSHFVSRRCIKTSRFYGASAVSGRETNEHSLVGTRNRSLNKSDAVAVVGMVGDRIAVRYTPGSYPNELICRTMRPEILGDSIVLNPRYYEGDKVVRLPDVGAR